ncbi:serine/threonine-protein kinase [Streptomyces sp. G-G2]|uniref:serine/threonine-protein kinase n=1 Tax=Streptomyces sp. G-G2 TaxID=3046201 RepID=UPI0024B8C419|nr:serine/threonine-protein kinase [Streptomyces sp. G-G2]MDJ0385859.1 serine/threonine-protein kinase [Streptomyces sp. G-G2]
MSGIRGAGPAPMRRLVLDRYALLERFHGGMAEVWKAHDQRLDRTVVAKFLRVTDRGTHPALRFLREAKILAAIDDPRIVRVHDVDEARIDGSWHLYLITQYIEGETLRVALPRGRRLAVDHALRWAAELCEALVPVHARDLVHRDIKPSNIMVRAAAPGPGGPSAATGGIGRTGATGHATGPTGRSTLVLLDFGIARSYTAVGNLGYAAGVTGLAQLVGTPEYMAPECFLQEPIGPATDLYAVGCVLFEMLTGRQPYSAPDDYGTLVNLHCRAAVPSVRGLRPEVPPAVDHLIARLLTKSPGERPADAREVAGLLRGLSVAVLPRPTVVVTPSVPPPPGPPPGLPTDPAQVVEARCNAVLEATERDPETPAGVRVRQLGDVLAFAYATLPADHRGIWLVVLHLAQALARAGQPAAAAERLAPVAARARQVLGADDQLAVLCALNLARYIGESGHPRPAAQHLLELRNAVSGVLAATDPKLSEIRYDQAHWLAAAGDTHRATAEFEALYADHWTAYGPDHPQTVRLRELIARTRA